MLEYNVIGEKETMLETVDLTNKLEKSEYKRIIPDMELKLLLEFDMF